MTLSKSYTFRSKFNGILDRCDAFCHLIFCDSRANNTNKYKDVIAQRKFSASEVGFGFAQLFELFPQLHFIIKCVGTLYLLYLAWIIAKSAGAMDTNTTNSQSEPLSFGLFSLCWDLVIVWLYAKKATQESTKYEMV